MRRHMYTRGWFLPWGELRIGPYDGKSNPISGTFLVAWPHGETSKRAIDVDAQKVSILSLSLATLGEAESRKGASAPPPSPPL
jgi:hypothetical protein